MWTRHRRIDFSDVDYPGTLFRADAANFRIPPTPRQIKYIIIHITGGPAQDEGPAINTFRHGPASAHYIVNRQGHVTQFVRDAHIANHVDNINSATNRDSIGIEHVNQWSHGIHMRPTHRQYEASARLVAWLCQRYNIPIVHDTRRHARGIRGHIEEQPHSGHTACPNPAWDWHSYISLVQNIQVPNLGAFIASLARDPFPME
ncbi:MAG: peptidoglycan recognition family protein [Pseudomonadota bacterium]|nr:peptidoglycan recognition family protein [Pseudomonadota bacterium]